MSNFYKALCNLNLTMLRFNFRYLKFSQAIRLPFFIAEETLLPKVKGKVVLPEIVYPGMIRIGFGNLGIADKKQNPCIWEVEGTIRFEGSATLGQGTVFSVAKTGTLTVGNNFKITGPTKI